MYRLCIRIDLTEYTKYWKNLIINVCYYRFSICDDKHNGRNIRHITKHKEINTFNFGKYTF